MSRVIQQINAAWRAHQLLWESSLNLIASENVPSRAVYGLLASDFGNRVAEGPLGGRLFPGMEHYDKIELIGRTICKDLFECDEVELRPISGTIANLAIFRALLPRAGKLLTLAVNCGGHVSMAGRLPQHFGYRVSYLPFDPLELNLDIKNGIRLISRLKPNMLLLGGSVLLFPQKIRELATAAKESGSVVVFDGAHIAGLIAGKQYPNPLNEGADILTFTTCKTIPGPQHAFIAGRKSYMAQINQAVSMLHSGHHLHATAAAVMSCAEMATFAKAYSRQIVRNSKALSRSLAESNIPVLKRRDGEHTETHMIMIDASRWGGGFVVERLLASAGIFVNRNLLHSDIPAGFRSPAGIRIGTAEVTRLGMKEDQMRLICDFIVQLLAGESPARITNKVLRLRRAFSELDFSFRQDLRS